MEMKEYSPTDFVNLIDTNFEQFVGKIDRINIQWGTWSREMNLVIRERMENKGEDGFVLGLVFSYWLTVSQLMDLLYKCTGLKYIIREKKIKKKTEEALALRKRVMEENENN